MRRFEENLEFLILEVAKQLRGARELLAGSNEGLIDKIEARDDYIDNLKTVIENSCYTRICEGENAAGNPINQVRAVNTVATNLERIGDFAVNIVQQTRYLSDNAFLESYSYNAFFDEIDRAMELIHEALFHRKISLAFDICRCESRLDMLYKEQFDIVREQLETGGRTGDLITTLFILRYLERIGDALLNIGEATIFSITGNKMKIRQYDALRGAVASSGKDIPITEVEFESIWGTRSGARIGKVFGGSPDASVIFKSGARSKLLKESENIERWHELVPGLAPRVVFQEEQGKDATLLIECMTGLTLEYLVLNGDGEGVDAAILELERTAWEIWERTLKPGDTSAGFMKQCRSRMNDVFLLHPEFRLPERRVQSKVIPSIDRWLDMAAVRELDLKAPFSVFIHGDFNANNLIFNREQKRVHYIDLHRSTDSDYLQDVSVFIVSNLRMPVFDRATRQRLQRVANEFLSFASHFARVHGDQTFEARLCLGLIRSFLTSTRFEYNKRLAWRLFSMGLYLLEKFTSHSGDYKDFKLPPRLLFH